MNDAKRARAASNMDASHRDDVSGAWLFDRYGAMAYRRCVQILRNEADAQDATQEVFLRVVRDMDRFRAGASWGTWIYRIATTYCLQQLRNRDRRRRKLAGLEPSPPEDRVPEDELAIRRVLSDFDASTQLLAYLRFVDGMTLEEVAEVSNLTRKTVAKRLAAFQRKARSKLGPGIEAWPTPTEHSR